MTRSHPRLLLTTRVRTGAALGLTTFLFALTILQRGHTKSGWLFVPGIVLHGWLLIAMNVFFYGYVCWLGFQLIRGTAGTERFFMVGWMTGFFLSPLHVLVPQWSEAIKCVGAIGLAVALLAALSLLLDPSGVTGSESGTEGT